MDAVLCTTFPLKPRGPLSVAFWKSADWPTSRDWWVRMLQLESIRKPWNHSDGILLTSRPFQPAYFSELRASETHRSDKARHEHLEYDAALEYELRQRPGLTQWHRQCETGPFSACTSLHINVLFTVWSTLESPDLDLATGEDRQR